MNPYLEVFVRSVGAFFAVLVLTRMIGKTQIAQLSVADFVNAIVIGSIGAVMATDVSENGWYYAFGLLVFSALTWGTEYVSLKYRPARKLLEGEPTVVIHNGKILERNMRKMTYNIDDLTMQLRNKDVFDISDVEFALLEPNGKLSVLLKGGRQAVKLDDMQIPAEYKGLSSELIVDGVIIEQNLKQNNLSREWLTGELQRRNIPHVGEVMLASLDTRGNLYIDKRSDDIKSMRDMTDKLPGKPPQ